MPELSQLETTVTLERPSAMQVTARPAEFSRAQLIHSMSLLFVAAGPVACSRGYAVRSVPLASHVLSRVARSPLRKRLAHRIAAHVHGRGDPAGHAAHGRFHELSGAGRSRQRAGTDRGGI